MFLTLNVFVSLDGVMQGPGGPEEDIRNGFTRGGWVAPFFDEESGGIVDSWFRKTTAFLLGHYTYDTFRGYWPQVTDPNNFIATQINSMPKMVATHEPIDIDWDNVTNIHGDVEKEVFKLKESGDGELQVHGSCGLAQSLHAAGLIDEYRIITFPVVLGQGKKLFVDGGPAVNFETLEHRSFENGITYSVLRPSEFETGEFQIVDGREVTVL